MSGTMVCAHKVGIPLFVTGGIGGVHRHSEQSEPLELTETNLRHLVKKIVWFVGNDITVTVGNSNLHVFLMHRLSDA